MIEHLQGREKALEPLGWTGREAEWIALVCLHSGVFTRSQFCRFCSPTVVDRKRALRFVRDLVGRGVAAEDYRTIFPGSAKACRIFSQEIYRKLGIENVRHRREAHTIVLLRRLLSLDYLLEHLQLPWLPTEPEKVGFFESLGIPRKLLPSRLYQGAVDKQTRYFPLKLPIAVDAKTATFAYVDPGNDTDTELRSWGRAHRHLWGLLERKGRAVHVAAIGPNHTATMRAGTALRRWVRAAPEATQIPEGLERDDPAAAWARRGDNPDRTGPAHRRPGGVGRVWGCQRGERSLDCSPPAGASETRRPAGGRRNAATEAGDYQRGRTIHGEIWGCQRSLKTVDGATRIAERREHREHNRNLHIQLRDMGHKAVMGTVFCPVRTAERGKNGGPQVNGYWGPPVSLHVADPGCHTDKGGGVTRFSDAL